MRRRWHFYSVVLVACLCCVLSLGQQASASSEFSALRYHATVVNGNLVGSAFALSTTIAVTNAHVVEGLSAGQNVDLVVSSSGNPKIVASVLAISRRMDLAVLRVPPGFLPPVSNRTVKSQAGMPIVAAGVDASGGRHSGKRLALLGQVRIPVRDIDVFGPGLIAGIPGVRPGFSGGPVLDRSGHLVGMLTAIRRKESGRTGRAASRAADPQASQLSEEAYVLRAQAVRDEAERLIRFASTSDR
ncbi:MAG: serine protease [Pseudomonadota bacterium]